MITKQTIIDLGWEVFPHSAYTPDLAPSNYHLFRSMEYFLRDKSFAESRDLRNKLYVFFDIKHQSFNSDGIRQLVIKWQKVKDNQRNYFNG